MTNVTRDRIKLVAREWTPLVEDHPSLSLASDELHVWQWSCHQSKLLSSRLQEFLSKDEMDRARRFRFDQHRNIYVVSRGILRSLLGGYMGSAPGALRFGYSEYGKPHLTDAASGMSVEFNVSHSGSMILWAFARSRRIGVDVEEIRHNFNVLEIAENFFSPRERTDLYSLPANKRPEAFFRCWTRKEAFIKALGEGLSHPLDRFDVPLSAGDTPSLLETRPDPEEASRWAMWNVTVPSGYAAALAAEL